MSDNLSPKPIRRGRSYGQNESLTVRLHGLIRNYPKGVGIFQEFIQNSDDAGASWVKIILDRRTFTGNQLPSQSMAELMGPALMIYNNQVFSDTDVKSLQTIGMGSKVQSSSKTGRFGLGFNACYNVTDYPSYLTRESIYFFDPHCNTVEGATQIAPGWAWDLTPDIWEDYPDLFRPFEILELQQGQLSFPGTIFRLPLRTEERAKHSLISREPFLETDFEELVSQFIPLGADMLIFLKHVTRISIYEIPSKGTALVELFDITTINEADVRENRDQVNQYVLDDPQLMVNSLRTKHSLPVVSFIHQIKLRTPSFEENQTWRVVNGLFVDEQRTIVTLIEKMYHSEEKAVPWAGAAARLSLERSVTTTNDFEEFQGKVFCFLPMHIQTLLPVHINGFFDLDSSRQTLTTNHETLSGKDAIRAEWNIQLVNLCVGSAYARLISDLVKDIGLSDIKTFYKFWPDPRKDLPGVLEGLSKAVYHHLRNDPVLHSADPENEWCSIQSLFLIPSEWQSELQSPLTSDAMLVPKPELPTHISKGFEIAGIERNLITPTIIRNRLRVSEDIDQPLAKVERPCLRHRKGIVSLLKFCLSDEPTTDLVGVPLAILSDGHLHTFGKFNASWAFLATEVERKIFAKFENWFIDPEFAKECGLFPIDAAKLSQMNPSIVIVNLGRILDYPADDSATWDPQATESPNDSWLCMVYEYLSSHVDYILKSEEAFKKLHLVPDQFNRLWKVSTNSTPLLAPEDLSVNLQMALTKLGFPIITGSVELISAIHEFQKKSSGKFIWGFTGRDFVDTLCEFAIHWQIRYPSYDPEIHVPLLDFLSLPQVIENLKQNEDRILKLKELPIYLTIDGRLVRANDSDLYLLANYELPTDGSALSLLNTGLGGRWKPLLQLMNINELDRPTLIQKILLPSYATLSPVAQIQILEWIRDNLSQSETEQQKKNVVGGSKVADLVANADLIFCTDRGYHACRTVYDPRQEQSIRAVLGDDALFPDMRMYHNQEERWLKFFFEDLGMTSAPRATAILQAIDKLIFENEEMVVQAVRDRLIAIFNYIVLIENWNRLIKERIGGASQSFSDLLSEKKWLPAQQDPKHLTRYAAYQVQEDRLYKPRELYMARQGHLVASQVPLAMIREPDQIVSKSLGFPENPPLSVVIKHFDAILTKWSTDDQGNIEGETLTRSIGEIYRYFGKLRETSDLDELKSHYGKKECLWNPKKELFCKPSHIFRNAVPYMEPWRTGIEIGEAQQDQGYTNLGRLTEPGGREFIEFLDDLQVEFRELSLSDDISRQVLQVLRHMSTVLIDNNTEAIFPVLTQVNMLIDYTDVYVPDARWLQDKLRKNAIHLLHADVPSDLIQSVGIKLLSKSIEERIAFPPSPSNDQELQSQCDRLQKLISSKEFRSGVERLIRAEHRDVRAGELNWIEKTKISAVQSIVVDFWLKENSNQKVGRGHVNYFFDPDTLTIYLAQQKPAVMYNILGQAINSQFDDLKLSDTASLTSILNCQPDEIDETLTDLHVTALPEHTPNEFGFQEFSELVDHIGSNDYEEMTDTDGLQEDTKNQIVSKGIEPPLGNINQTPMSYQESGSQDIKDEKEENEDKEEKLNDTNGEQRNIYNNPGVSDFSQSENGGSRVPKISNGEDVPPPTQPGDGKSWTSDQSLDEGSDNNYHPREQWAGKNSGKHSRAYSRNDRVFTSGVYSNQSPRSESDETDSLKDEIGKRAVDRVIDYETSRGHKPKSMPHNNPGYDVEVYAADGQTLLMYIEVKGINGPWGIGGVSISSSQYGFGELHTDKFWLYVVEFALDDNAFRIYPIQNPTQQITNYRFDHGWKELANTEAKLLSEPVIGLHVRNKLDQTEGVIVDVKGMGILKQITIRYEDGREEQVTFKPNQMELIFASGE